MNRCAPPTPDVPTVIAFFGQAPDYLKHCLDAAAAFNRRVVLVGDGSNRCEWSDHWSIGADDPPKFRAFLDVYSKMSDYPDFYEQAFWRRPFAIEAWMRAEGVDRAFVIDSDVVTFADYASDVLPCLPEGCEVGVMTEWNERPFGWASSMHLSYWTRSALEAFTSFCIEAYRDAEIRADLEAKWRWHLDEQRPGGVCEMTLLYLWQVRSGVRAANLAEVHRGIVGDMAVGLADNSVASEYAVRLGAKRFRFQDGIPYGQNLLTGEEIRFACVHCQGHYKGMMAHLKPGALQSFYNERFIAASIAHTARWRAGTLARRVHKRGFGTRRGPG